MAVCPATSMVLLQGPPAEVTKSQFFRVHAQVLGCTCAEREVHVSLHYDGDLAPVPPAIGHEVVQGKTVSHTASEFILDLRINELSHAHRNQRFVIRLAHGLCVLDAAPVKVMSKSCIVRAHLQGGSNTAAANAAASAAAHGGAREKRKRDAGDSPVADDPQTGRVVEVCRRVSAEMASLRSMCWEQQAQAARLADTVAAETATLRAEVASVANAVQALVALVESLTGVTANRVCCSAGEPTAASPPPHGAHPNGSMSGAATNAHANVMLTPQNAISDAFLLSGTFPLPAPLFTPMDVLKEPVAQGAADLWPLTHIS